MTDYGFTAAPTVTAAERYRENRERALLKRLRSKQRLTEADIERKAASDPSLNNTCGVHRVVWKRDDSGVQTAWLQKLPCNGRRAEGYECCFLCSQWFENHRQLLEQWFSIGVTLNRRCAVYFRNANAAQFKRIWSLPYEDSVV